MENNPYAQEEGNGPIVKKLLYGHVYEVFSDRKLHVILLGLFKNKT